MTDFSRLIIALAPYLSGIIAAAVGYLTYRESKRKTSHDELHELYEERKAAVEQLKKENDKLKKELEKNEVK